MDEKKVENAPEKDIIAKENINTGTSGLEAKWYALHTFSGYENVAKENLETVVDKFNYHDRIFDIVIPMEDVVEEKNGKKKLVQRKAFPCYILVKMKYADDLWHNIINTRGITGFVGPNARPLALSDEEVMRLRLEKIKVEVDLNVGDTVVALNPETNIVSATVEMFGRETQVDLGYAQVRKVNN